MAAAIPANSTVFKFHDIERFTNNFSADRRLGSGGFGEVYMGISANGDEIAVKKLHQMQGIDDEFDKEFQALMEVNHKNIIRLIGYCTETRGQYVRMDGKLVLADIRERVLCFEFMKGGSLADQIKDDSCILEWPKCYQIIKGTCDGLDYMHNSHAKPILHRDIKPENILLDKNMTAKIADLGLSKLVASTKTYKTLTEKKGTKGFMPPEYIDYNKVSPKFDVYSLGALIIKIMDGHDAYYSGSTETDKEIFIERVCEKWRTKLQAKSGCSSYEIEIKRVKKCIEIALRSVERDHTKRPLIKEIVKELEQLEEEIKKMTPPSDLSEDLIALQRNPGSYVIAVDPALELRFLFEPGKDISSCLQLTNMTGGFFAFDIKTNQTKYRAQPSKGVMPPCSKRYISVTLIAQKAAPQNMLCEDMFVVQTATASSDMISDDITEDFFKKAMDAKEVDIVKLPIVYIAQDRFEL